MKWIPIALAALFGSRVVLAGPDFSLARSRFKYWDKFDSAFKQEGANYAIDWQWLKAIAIVESSLGQNSSVESGGVSSDGKSYGLMQMTLVTARWLRLNTTVSDLNNPDISIKLAAQYLNYLKTIFNDERKIIMSYNQGQGNTLKGKEYASDYYKKFQDALKLVKEGK